MEKRTIEVNLGHVGASSNIDLDQSFLFNESGIYTQEYGEDAGKGFTAFYNDKQVDDMITALSYYKMIKKEKGLWRNGD